MGEKTVSAGEAQARLGELLKLVRDGHEVVISDGDNAVARLVPVRPKRRIAGLTRGAVHMSPDFDEPLPDSFWLGDE
jgi:prevent-host-death family protein